MITVLTMIAILTTITLSMRSLTSKMKADSDAYYTKARVRATRKQRRRLSPVYETAY